MFKLKLKNNKGMTLVELMMVLSIFAIISLVTIFDYANFSSSVSLQNLTDDVALSIRKTQSYAMGSKGFQNMFVDNRYMISFSSEDDKNKSFTIYSLQGGKYPVEQLDINTGDFIEGFTGNDLKRDNSINSLDIVFKRPNPDAKFYLNDSNEPADISLSRVGIILSNRNRDSKKLIYITKLGKISIKNYEESE